MNDDKSLIYGFHIYQNLGFFVCLNSTTGAVVGNRYSTSGLPTVTMEMKFKSNKVYFGFHISNFNFVIYDVVNGSMTEYLSNM